MRIRVFQSKTTVKARVIVDVNSPKKERISYTIRHFTLLQLRRSPIHGAPWRHRSGERRRALVAGDLHRKGDPRPSEVLARWILQRHRRARTH